MKRILALLLTTAMLLSMTAFAVAEDTTADTTASATMTPQGGQGGGVQDGRVSGTITAIGDGSITLDIRMGGQPPAGDPPQGDGSGRQNGAQPGNPPQAVEQSNAQQGAPNGGPGGNGGGPGGNGGAPQGGGKGDRGNGNAPQQPANDNGQAQASQSLTVAVTGSTTIQNEDGTTLALADLSVGTAVSVTVTGDATSGYTATAITTLTAPAQDGATTESAAGTQG